MDPWKQKWESEVISQRRSIAGGNKTGQNGKSPETSKSTSERKSHLCTSALANIPVHHPQVSALPAASEGRGGGAEKKGRYRR